MNRKALLAALAATAVAMAGPAIASATDSPELPSGVDQAYLADSDGNPENGSLTLVGTLSMTSGGTVTCNTDFTVDFFDDGTSTVSDWVLSNCVLVGAPSCNVAVFPTQFSWGNRFGYDTSSGTYKDYIDIVTDFSLGTGCPFTGTFSQQGVLSPTVSVASGTISYAFSSGSGSLTSPFGPATWSGTLTGSVGPGTQLVA